MPLSLSPYVRAARRVGAAGARAEVERTAELLGAGVAKALLGTDVLSDELPYVTGSIGLLGSRPSYELMRDRDTLPTIGSSRPYSQFLPDLGTARGVRIDIEPYMVGIRHAGDDGLRGAVCARREIRAPGPAIALVGDAAMQLNGMAELITAAEYRHLWEDPRLVIAVFNNHDLNQVTWEMRAMGGVPSFLSSQSCRTCSTPRRS